MHSRLALLVLSLAFAGAADAGPLRCEGRVFLDRDGDGRFDRGEPGLADVRGSAGARIQRTDAKGERYYLEDAEIAKETARARQAVQQWCG